MKCENTAALLWIFNIFIIASDKTFYSNSVIFKICCNVILDDMHATVIYFILLKTNITDFFPVIIDITKS